jgi:hypothetical protein
MFLCSGRFQLCGSYTPFLGQALQPPSRREALFGLLGAGLGVGIAAGYYNSELWLALVYHKLCCFFVVCLSAQILQ